MEPNSSSLEPQPQPRAAVVRDLKFFQVLEDGQLLFKIPRSFRKVPPCPNLDSDSEHSPGVLSKDVIISTSPPISARIFLPPRLRLIPDPNGDDDDTKLPVLFYIHGGAFHLGSPFATEYHSFLSSLVAAANVVSVSVDYGLFPDRPIPACYDDSWAALQWVASHSTTTSTPSSPSFDLDPWLIRHADFDRLFIAGDSAGGNITHSLTLRAGTLGLPGRVRVVGAVLIHPYFGGIEADDEAWMYMCPDNEGPQDRRMIPPEEDLARLGCEKVLVFVAENDHLCGPGKAYFDRLLKSGWKGTAAEIVENKGKQHCFFLFRTEDDEAVANQKRIVSFVHDHDHDPSPSPVTVNDP